MNEARWNSVGRDFAIGKLAPACGYHEWREIAKAEADRIAFLLGENVQTIVEVGCGVGRLTPFLAERFDSVIATDTSTVMRNLTRQLCAHHENVTVSKPRLYPYDAALVWGNLYDSDWSDDAAIAHLTGLVVSYPRVLVQTTRDAITNAMSVHCLAQGDDWMLLRDHFPEKG